MNNPHHFADFLRKWQTNREPYPETGACHGVGSRLSVLSGTFACL